MGVCGGCWQRPASDRPHSLRRRSGCAPPWAFFVLGVLLVGAARPENSAAEVVGATSSDEARKEAIRAMPWNQLGLQQRRAVQHVIRKASLYRRLPTQVVDCDADLFTFLMQHPEVIIDTWRTMGVSQVTLDRVGQAQFRVNDGAGTQANFHYLDSTWGDKAFNRMLIYANGSYEGGPFAGSINARAVLLVRSGSVVETNGRTYVTVRLDSFVYLEQIGVELLAKTIHPLVGRTADHNFIETLKFVSNFSRTAERNPGGMERFTSRLTGVDPLTRAQLVQICYDAAGRYALNRQRPPVPVEQVARHDEIPKLVNAP